MSADWPSFSTGPRESIFALGVICVKFVELESVFQFVFETVLGLDPNRDMGKIVFARLGTGPALQLCEDCLRQMGRSDEVKDQISHFLSAMKMCDLRGQSQLPDALSHGVAVRRKNRALQES